MSVSFTLTDSPVFPEGSTVKCYPTTNWPVPGQPSGAPIGSASAEGTVSGGSVTFSALEKGKKYWAVAEVGGVYRYVKFIAGEDVAKSAGAAGKAEIEAEETRAKAAEAEKAAKTEVAELDTDGTLAANSNIKVASQKATKTAIATAQAAAESNAQTAARDALRLSAMGLVSEPYPLAVATGTAQLLTSKKLIGALVGIPAGKALTGIVVGLTANAASLESLYAMLFSKTGELLTVSPQNQKNALDSGAANTVRLPFFSSGTYTPPAADAYYAAILPVSAAGTLPTIARGQSSSANAGVGSGVNPFVSQTGQTTPPAPATLAKASEAVWIGVY